MTMQTHAKQQQVTTFAFAALGVPDLTAAVDFYTRGAALTCRSRTDTEAELATTDGEVALLLVAGGDRGLQRLAYAVADSDALTRFADRLAAAGVEYRRAGLGSGAADALTFADPDGYPLALVVRKPSNVAFAPAETLVGVEQILHPLVQVRDLERSIEFYGEVLGFRMSDRIADVTAFMRCADTFHHSLAITVARQEITLDHICFQLRDLDTLMRARNRLRRAAGAECTETFRHGGSESITFYFQDPHSGQQIEYCTEHRTITDDDHRPRVLAAAATTFDLWQRYEDEAGL